jgi:hypothetical protein
MVGAMSFTTLRIPDMDAWAGDSGRALNVYITSHRFPNEHSTDLIIP